MASTARIAIAMIVTAAALAAVPAVALPRYTARYEQKCALCHVNPSGGGMRTGYATQQLVPEEIAWSPAKPQALEQIENAIPSPFLIGTDFRQIYQRTDIPDQDLNFFEMQADLYLGFQLSPKTTLYYDRGQSDSYELFGLVYPIPTFYIKAGRFLPSYGWKHDDHTMYVRADLELDPPGSSDVGLEAGFSKGPVDLQVGLLNGSRGTVQDTDDRLAQMINVLYRFHAGPLGAGIGASAYHNPASQGDYDTAGLYGYLTFQRLTWLGEVDVVDAEVSGGTVEERLATSHELTWLVRQGFEIKATYDAYDPDRDLATGARSRWGAGLFTMPWSYLTLETLVRHTKVDDGLTLSGEDYTEMVVQLHVLY